MTPWNVACQAPPSMGFSRQEYWSVIFLSREGRDLGVAFQAPPGSQASSRGVPGFGRSVESDRKYFRLRRPPVSGALTTLQLCPGSRKAITKTKQRAVFQQHYLQKQVEGRIWPTHQSADPCPRELSHPWASLVNSALL